MSQLCRRCILVVDNHEDTNLLFAVAFEVEGAEVIAVASAEDALKILTWRRPDVIVCDIALPYMDGCSLLSTIRTSTERSKRRIPAIAVTAYCDRQTKQQAFDAGFQSYFVKPVDLDELISTIADLTIPKVHSLMRTEVTSLLEKLQQM